MKKNKTSKPTIILNPVQAFLEERKTFKKFTVRDVVFLAIVTVVLIVTCSVMPLVKTLNQVIFGIAQLVTALQISLFLMIAVYKVRKTGTILIISIFLGAVQTPMAPIMGFSSVLTGLMLEFLAVVFFDGYRKNIHIFVIVSLYSIMTLPLGFLYNYLLGKEIMIKVAIEHPLRAFGMSIAIYLTSILGATIGLLISRELKKTGVLKK